MEYIFDICHLKMAEWPTKLQIFDFQVKKNLDFFELKLEEIVLFLISFDNLGKKISKNVSKNFRVIKFCRVDVGTNINNAVKLHNQKIVTPSRLPSIPDYYLLFIQK